MISGVDGYIGKEISQLLSRKKKYKLFLLSNKKKNFFIHQDLTKPINLNIKPYAVIHCAAKHKFSKKKNDMKNIYSTNIRMTKNLINFCNEQSVKKLIFLSSVDVYGKIKEKKIFENLKPYKVNLYGKSKLMSEKMFCNKKNKFKTLCLRIPGVFTLNLSKNYPLIVKMTKDIIKNKNLYSYNLNKKFNNILDVEEIVKFIEVALKKKIIKSKSYNFSSSKPIKFIEVINLVKKIFNSKSKIINKDLKKNSFTISNSEITKDFSFPIASTNKILLRCCRSILNKGNIRFNN
jgi:nucleoside-diphosphate-sugar epimerase